MTSRILINNDVTSSRAVIVHFSNDSATRLLKPGESADAAIYQDMCINLIESEEDYSHGEVDDLQTGTVVNQDGDAVSPVDIPIEFSPKEGE